MTSCMHERAAHVLLSICCISPCVKSTWIHLNVFSSGSSIGAFSKTYWSFEIIDYMSEKEILLLSFPTYVYIYIDIWVLYPDIPPTRGSSR